MKRKTEEVEIEVELGKRRDIETGDKVLDHMLESMTFYMEMNSEIKAEWDIRHHLWEDMGIILGEALSQHIEGKDIERFGNTLMPMDDALLMIAVDISRPYLRMDLDIEEEESEFEISLVKEFFEALSRTLCVTIHIEQRSGHNGHHIIEAAFKGMGVTLGQALKESGEVKSTKGVL